MKEQAQKVWVMPNGTPRRFAWATIERWYYLYRNGGLANLEPVIRKDDGIFRVLGDDVIKGIGSLMEIHPRIRISTLIRQLEERGLVKDGVPSDSTVYRYIRLVRQNTKVQNASEKEMRAFEAPYSGSLAQVDVMYGPYISCRGKDGKTSKKKTYLIAIIDDHSRLLCHGQFYFEQNLLAYLDCLKQSIQKRGIMERLYCDNGQIFLSSHVKKILANLGSRVINTAPADPCAKGKIERFFLSVRQDFIDTLYVKGMPNNLDALNREFTNWYDEKYNKSIHSSIKSTPLAKWTASLHKVKLITPLQADNSFVFEETRKVKNDGTFSLGGEFFETHSALAGKKIDIKFDPFFPERVFVSYEKQNFGRASLLDRNFNAAKHRRKLNEGLEE